MPGFVAMLAVFAVVSIEQFFAMRGAKHDHSGGLGGLPEEEGGYSDTESLTHSNRHIPLHNVVDTPTMDTPSPKRSKFKDKDEEDDSDYADDLDAFDPIAEESAALSRPTVHNRHDSVGHDSSAGAQDPQKMFLQCLLLEAGILFHSIFIGMAVSVATGTAFVVLLIAICFHQTFEGFALGARIANLIPALFDARSPKPWLMCLAYGMTTPLGQIIGLLLHRLYDPNSEAGLLTVGITNAISSGLLLFAGLVQLVAEDFLADSSYKALKGSRRIEANLAVACGGLLMAFTRRSELIFDFLRILPVSDQKQLRKDNESRMALSTRGQQWAKLSSDMLIWKIIQDLWDPETNPDGYASLGVAENALMHEEMTKYLNENIHLQPNDLTYGNGGKGTKKLKEAMARFLTRKLKPVVPFEASHICITNGVSPSVEHLSSIFADAGDAFLLGQPHYGAFIPDIELRPETKVAQVSFGDTDPLSLKAVSAYERTIESCKSMNQKVAGLMLCNPHNPLGRCYSREYIIELMKLCQKHQIHLVSDEIYALSVFRQSDPTDDSVIPFTSLASIPTDGLIDPALTHVLYGLSKDFGANGLRLGCIASQHNPDLHNALTSVSIYSYISSLADSIATKLLSDDEFVDWYSAENNKRLEKHYDLVVAWAEEHGIEYAKGVNAAFFLWVNLGKTYDRSVQQGKIEAREVDKEKKLRLRRVEDSANEPPEAPAEAEPNDEAGNDIDVVVNDALLEQKVFLASGVQFGSERPGWFRIVFSQDEKLLRLGLSRIEKALGLTASAENDGS
ncbi:hypothetical protein LTR70_003946 [Exophiala xenobiotica]|nr:hypothetical protein LTR70_003946 [Exophiala xenobiotica]